LDSGKPDDSIRCTRRFLDHIRRHPRRKRLLWLAWSVYTTRAEAMALNNLGAAYLKAGDLAAADSALREALATDPKYPLPYYNLAIERAASDDPAEAQRLAAEARRLGYHGTAVDDLVRQAQTLLARVEGSVTADKH
jgi:Flp pilus assembly protein TadD